MPAYCAPQPKRANAVYVNLDDSAQVNALFEAVAARVPHERLADYLRQHRSPEDIRADNAAAQADYDRARDFDWSVR